VLIRPLSGSGSTAVLTELVKQLGSDNILSFTAATIYGSAETTFYVVAVYFGSVGVTKTRHAIPTGLCADLVGAIASVFACRLLFHRTAGGLRQEEFDLPSTRWITRQR